jgi:hypothetical protein
LGPQKACRRVDKNLYAELNPWSQHECSWGMCKFNCRWTPYGTKLKLKEWEKKNPKPFFDLDPPTKFECPSYTCNICQNYINNVKIEGKGVLQKCTRKIIEQTEETTTPEETRFDKRIILYIGGAILVILLFFFFFFQKNN